VCQIVAKLPPSDVDDQTGGRQTATPPKQRPAGECASALVAAEGVLPPEAWADFRRAVALVVRQLPCSAPEALPRLLRLLATVPPRLASLEFQGAAYLQLCAGESRLLATALAAACFRSSLQRLELHSAAHRSAVVISAQAADLLGGGLPGLTSMALMVALGVGGAGGAWRPVLPPRLAELDLVVLGAAAGPGAAACELDLSGASAASAAAGAGLRELQLQCSGEVTLQLGCLAQLAQLRRLQLDCPARPGDSAWQLLGGLAQLQHAGLELPLEVCRLPPAPLQHLRSLDAERLGLRGLPRQQLRGCLAAALPCLQRLQLSAPCCLREVAAALAGHPALRSLALQAEEGEEGGEEGEEEGGEEVPLGFGLRHLPQLVQLQLALPAGLPRALARDLGGCEALRELELELGAAGRGGGVAAMRALGGGAAGRRLRRVALRGSAGASLSAVAALLGEGIGAGPAEAEVEVEVCHDLRASLSGDGEALEAALAGGAPAGALLCVAHGLAAGCWLLRGLLEAAAGELAAANAEAACVAAACGRERRLQWGAGRAAVLVRQRSWGAGAPGGACADVLVGLAGRLGQLDGGGGGGGGGGGAVVPLLAGVAQGLWLREQLAVVLAELQQVARAPREHGECVLAAQRPGGGGCRVTYECAELRGW
jgi:hypothetical protein